MFTLGRKIDIHYGTNISILIAAITVAAIGWVVTGSILSGLSIGVGVFLAWALAREIDPRHEYSAFIGAALASLNLLYYKSISLLVVFWILLLIRTVNGITGKEITAFDILSLLGLSLYLSFNNRNAIYLVIFIISMSILIIFKERVKISFLASATALGFFIFEIFFLGYAFFNIIDYSEPIKIWAVAIVFIFMMFSNFISNGKIRDDVGNTVKKAKIMSGQILFSAIVLLLLLFGDIGLNNLIIYISAIVGVIIYFILYKLLILKRV